ncbi:hypothetical protein [Arthrobacter sp. NamB2]|uniref:hypothetical protein n=1 Tax=Arthrobacter sp. NamB2 TaxID=2576035 RepID=UPI0026882A8C|nr:hypothetical protein [Arthrobacter sp. NamB2]
MENLPDHEYQRIHLLRAIRHAKIESSELWLHYFGLGGDAGEYEVEAYLHGSFTLPPLQRDLLAQAANELIDRIPPPPRAPYSTDPAGTGTTVAPGGQVEEAAPDGGGSALTWLFDHRPASETGGSGTDSDGANPPQPTDS